MMQETIASAKKAFGIENTEVVLSTISLDVCRGQQVEIDSSAYPHLWRILDEVFLTDKSNGI